MNGLHSASIETPLIGVPRPATFAMTTKTVGNQLQQLARQWPADPFRPHLQLKTFLESLSHHPSLTDGAVIATRSLLQNDLRHKVRRYPYSSACTHGHATFSRFRPQYRLGERMMKPASAPHHYDRLAEAFEKSSQGIGRPWWKRFFNMW
jgi:hypothetical protein